MLNLDSIKIEVRQIDISKMITGVTIYESIFGLLKGAITVKDGINFFDNFIGTDLAPIDFTFSYLNKEFRCGFMVDGISNMRITKQVKDYIIHLVSFHTPVFAESINGTFSGTSDEIISDIFADISHHDAKLEIDSVADTSGRYIAPNIPARSCLDKLVKNAYDVQQSGMFLYQRFADNNAIRLTSLGDMLKNYFIDEVGDEVSIKDAVLDGPAGAPLSGISTLGTSATFIMKEYNMDLVQKLEDGIWGEQTNVINLDETKRTKNVTKEATEIPKTKFKLSDKLYADDVKSIFATRGDVANSAIFNHKVRTFNSILEVKNMVALPTLGVGMCITLEMGGGNRSYSRQDGHYLVKHIQHNFTIDGGKYEYSQDLGLARES